MKTSIAIAVAGLTTFGFTASASAEKPGFYSGEYPVSVSRSSGPGNFDDRHCLILNDDGSLGFPHSGEATTPGAGVVFGTFYIVGHTLLVTLDQPGGTGVDDSLVFSGPAGSGSFGNGVYGQVYGAANNVGLIRFGTKGGR
jgi:hypothetical protein